MQKPSNQAWLAATAQATVMPTIDVYKRQIYDAAEATEEKLARAATAEAGQSEMCIRDSNYSELDTLPVIYVDRPSRSQKNSGVIIESDNEQGGYLATKELLDAGCRRIVILKRCV